MAVGSSGKAINSTTPVAGAGPKAAAGMVGKHVHKQVGPGGKLVGGPGCTDQAPANTPRTSGLK